MLLLYPPPRSRSEVQMEQGKLEGWCSGWYSFAIAAIAQLGERQTEDLKVPGSIPGLGTLGQPSIAKRTLSITLSNRQDFHLARNP